MIELTFWICCGKASEKEVINFMFLASAESFLDALAAIWQYDQNVTIVGLAREL